MKSKQGFTLIPILVVIGVIAILAAIVLFLVNPGRKFSQARDTQRRSDLYSIINAIYQYADEHRGMLPDTDRDDSTSNFPITATCIGSGEGCFNLGVAGNEGGTEPIIPTYIVGIPEDPQIGTNTNTGYTIFKDANGRIVASASGEITEGLTVMR